MTFAVNFLLIGLLGVFAFYHIFREWILIYRVTGSWFSFAQPKTPEILRHRRTGFVVMGLSYYVYSLVMMAVGSYDWWRLQFSADKELRTWLSVMPIWIIVGFANALFAAWLTSRAIERIGEDLAKFVDLDDVLIEEDDEQSHVPATQPLPNS